jgi:protocatechuate 3,4-dioxygenase beta subunit
MSIKTPRNPNPNIALLNRRQVLGTLCAFGAAGVATPFGIIPSTRAATTAASCTLSPALTEGPYWVDEGLNRFDVTAGSTLAAIAGAVPLYLYLNIVDANCNPLSGVQVDIWHCHAAGSYSDENQASNGASTLGQTWLRGYRISSESGSANFKTIYPGWYRGRTTHIHVRARYYDANGNVSYNWTTQLFFDDTTSDAIFANAPYSARMASDVYNSTDNIFSGGGSQTMLALVQTGSGAYTGTATLSLNLATAADEIWQDGFA